jgi:hypothetical protein
MALLAAGFSSRVNLSFGNLDVDKSQSFLIP